MSKQTHPQARAYEGIGYTPKDWRIVERCSDSDDYLPLGKPVRNPITIYRHLAERREHHANNGCTIVEDGKDGFRAYLDGTLVAEAVVVGVPRSK